MVKSIIVGGGEVSPSLEKEVQELPIEIYATYGMTETSSHIALRRVNGSERKDFYTIIGHTKINVDVRGCLTIDNPYLFEGRLVTNDIVEVLNSKEFRWLGRYDNVINSGGIKIMPEEIEKSITHLRSEMMVVSSIPNDKLGDAVVLVIEGEQITEEEKLELLSQIKLLVHPYALPTQTICIAEISRTSNGKVDRQSLKRVICKR